VSVFGGTHSSDLPSVRHFSSILLANNDDNQIVSSGCVITSFIASCPKGSSGCLNLVSQDHGIANIPATKGSDSESMLRAYFVSLSHFSRQ
jgi:hypothetical protein